MHMPHALRKKRLTHKNDARFPALLLAKGSKLMVLLAFKEQHRPRVKLHARSMDTIECTRTFFAVESRSIALIDVPQGNGIADMGRGQSDDKRDRRRLKRRTRSNMYVRLIAAHRENRQM